MFIKRVSKVSLGAIGGLLSAITGAFLGWIFFPFMVDINIDKQTLIKEGTETYERWVDIPQPLHFKVYLFNVTNPDEVLVGGTPKVKEIGPYIYRQYRHKDVKRISPDKKFIAYRGIQTFFFDEEASSPLTENDELVMINVQLNSVVQSVDRSIPPQLSILNAYLKEIFGKKYTSIFMTTTPADLLFNGIPLCVKPSGLAKVICSVIRKQRPKAIAVMEDGSMKFSMFGFKNNSDDGLFDIYTGVGDMDKLGTIRKWEHLESTKFWRNSKNGGISICNMINGTDSTVFAPRIPKSSIYIYATDICRSVRIQYKEEVVYEGIPAYRYETGDDFLRDIGPEYGNECFCMDRIEHIPSRPNGCLHRGALDLSTCQGGPIVMTLPHMLGAAEEYRTVEGLHADVKKHLIFADIEPHTGYPVRAAKRVQLNMFLKPVNQIPVTEKLQTVLTPILWVDEGIELNESMQSLIKTKLLIILMVLHVVHYSLLIGGIIAFVVFGIWYLVRRNDSNKVISIS